MPRRARTAADFPPEFMDAWNLAVQGKLLLSMPDVGKARNMIQQLYIFRRRLMEEAPAIAAPFMLVDLRVHDEMGNVITSRKTNVPGRAQIRPYVSDWKQQLRQQVSSEGVAINTAALPPEPVARMAENLPVLPNAMESGDNSGDAMSSTLSDLGYSTGDSK